ncbi:MAG: M50 family metallopeptidase [Chloroflexi bacterium]|nr:M50 family metallopeptidase [Chloroflexota bacterium]
MRDLALRHFERTGTLDPDAVFATVAALQVAGFATSPRVAKDALDGRLLRALDAVLAPRFEIGHPDGIFAALYSRLRPLHTVPAAAAAAVVGLGGLVAAVPVLRTASPFDFGAGGILVAFVALLLSGIGHETAHALAAKAEGARLGRAGIGLFWFTPVVYLDTSATWAIPRWGRIRVNAAGPLFNLLLAGIFAASRASRAGPRRTSSSGSRSRTFSCSCSTCPRSSSSTATTCSPTSPARTPCAARPCARCSARSAGHACRARASRRARSRTCSPRSCTCSRCAPSRSPGCRRSRARCSPRRWTSTRGRTSRSRSRSPSRRRSSCPSSSTPSTRDAGRSPRRPRRAVRSRSSSRGSPGATSPRPSG